MTTEEPRSQQSGKNEGFSEKTINRLGIPKVYRGIFQKVKDER